MSKEKQIEEMAKVIDQAKHDMWAGECPTYAEHSKNIAKYLYAAGYRKQSEGEWIKKYGFLVCSECDATKPIAFSTALKITYYKCDFCPKCGAKMRKEDEGNDD